MRERWTIGTAEPGAEILFFSTISPHFRRLPAIVAILGFQKLTMTES
jgi:hypothetical protein